VYRGGTVSNLQSVGLRNPNNLANGVSSKPRKLVSSDVLRLLMSFPLFSFYGRRKTTMYIGNENLFSVGCRVEATSIGSHNVFEAKCKVSPDVEISHHCFIGAGCTVVAEPSLSSFKSLEEIDQINPLADEQAEASKPSPIKIRKLVDYSVIFGDRSDLSQWSGEGQGQAKALHAKHLLYLSETLPKFHRTRVIAPSKMKEGTSSKTK
jgi:dynactin-6